MLTPVEDYQLTLKLKLSKSVAQRFCPNYIAIKIVKELLLMMKD